MEEWLSIDLTQPLKEIQEVYEAEIAVLMAKVTETPLKELGSIDWIGVRLIRLTETVIHVIAKLKKVYKEFDEILRNLAHQVRSEFNAAQFRIYFMSQNWNYYGFGRFISPENMKELFDDNIKEEE